jgi:DNA-binding NarL/FixJ family response regulator
MHHGRPPDNASLLARILRGDGQKTIAYELGLAPSTVSGRYMRALGTLEVSPRRIPLALVLAAQSAAGIGPMPRASSGFFDHDETAFRIVSVARPLTSRMTMLTPTEQEIAQWIIEGASRLEISRRRATSVHTVARQFHLIFRTMQVTGRFALIRRAIELQCFR